MKAFVVAAPARAVDVGAAARVRRASTSPRSRCRATSRWSTSCRTPRPAGWPSTGCPPSARPARSTSRHLDELRMTTRRRLAAHAGSASSDRRPHHGRRARPAGRDHGPALAHRARLPARHAARADGRASDACSTPCSSRWPTTGSRPSALGARLTYTGRARGDPGRGRGRAARRGQRVPRPRRRHRGVPARRAPRRRRGGRRRRRDARRDRGARRSRRGAPPASGSPGSAIRCTRTTTRARRASTSSPRRRGCSARTCGCSRSSPTVHERAHRPAPADQRRRRGRRRARRPRRAAGERARLRAHRPHRGPRRPPRRGGRRADRHAALARGRGTRRGEAPSDG